MVEQLGIDPDFSRDVLESDIPRDVLDVLLLDRTTGKNIMWMTDGYQHLESVFDVKMGVHDEINADVISRRRKCICHLAINYKRKNI
ncbi:MAG: hypothetical protein J6T51_08170 [Kiritimatiellae bacterium]|nr:hypothetical protein [Kiritimatiellia bacterium]